MFRILAILAAQLILSTGLCALNHSTATWQLSLYAGGLFLMFPALAMGLKEGLAVSMFAGLMMDASAPDHFGISALLFGLAFLFVLQMRPRLALEEPMVQAFLAVIVNMALYLLRAVIEAHGLPSASALWGRYLWEILISSVLVAILCPWFSALQQELLGFTSLASFSRRRREED